MRFYKFLKILLLLGAIGFSLLFIGIILYVFYNERDTSEYSLILAFILITAGLSSALFQIKTLNVFKNYKNVFPKVHTALWIGNAVYGFLIIVFFSFLFLITLEDKEVANADTPYLIGYYGTLMIPFIFGLWILIDAYKVNNIRKMSKVYNEMNRIDDISGVKDN